MQQQANFGNKAEGVKGKSPITPVPFHNLSGNHRRSPWNTMVKAPNLSIAADIIHLIRTSWEGRNPEGRMQQKKESKVAGTVKFKMTTNMLTFAPT